MSFENGNISINTENIFPIIKKWLYSEKDIFIREIVSNASDAISKMKKLVTMGEASLKEGEEYKINVYVDRKNNFLRVEDNGIGMTAEEVKKYINQIVLYNSDQKLNLQLVHVQSVYFPDVIFQEHHLRLFHVLRKLLPMSPFEI